jgi:hypothetical protein
MATDLSLDQLRLLAQRAGLKLTDGELQKMLSGVNRTRLQAEELRQLIAKEVAPAGHFSPLRGN